MTSNKLPLLSAPITEQYFVTLQPGIEAHASLQGMTGLIRAIRSDGFLEIDFSSADGPASVFLDSFQLIECSPLHEMLEVAR